MKRDKKNKLLAMHISVIITNYGISNMNNVQVFHIYNCIYWVVTILRRKEGQRLFIYTSIRWTFLVVAQAQL